MDALEAILTRRSIRKYTKDPITDQEIEILMQAAMSAPSSGNAQPWHFIIIRDHKTLDEIPKFHPFAGMLPGAQAAILVCGDEKLENHPGRLPQDCSAATQNILLAAHAQGIGAVWVNVHPDEDRVEGVRNLYKLPPNIHPVSLVVLGWPNEKRLPSRRYKQQRIHKEHW